MRANFAWLALADVLGLGVYLVGERDLIDFFCSHDDKDSVRKVTAGFSRRKGRSDIFFTFVLRPYGKWKGAWI